MEPRFMPWARAAALLFMWAPCAWSQASADCAGGEAYDDGGFEALFAPFYGGPNGRMHYVSRFTPASYPFSYNEVCLLLHTVTPASLDFAVVFFDDDGAGFAPGTLLAEVPRMIGEQTGWVSVGLGCGVPVTSGSVWIGLRWIPSSGGSLAIGADTSTSHPYYWSVDGANWNDDSTPGPAALMIRAKGLAGAATPSATFRNGSGVNPLCYVSAPPIINGLWTARVNHAIYPTATFTQVHIRAQPATGPSLPAGELLLDLASARFFVSTVISTSLSDLHQQAVPNDASLSGISMSTQGVIFGSNGVVLCNAYDLVAGCRGP